MVEDLHFMYNITINGTTFTYKEGPDYKTTLGPEVQAYTVEAFYNRPSAAKIAAENEIFDIMSAFSGFDYGITGGNKCTFSAVWYFRLDGSVFLVKETHASRYLIGPKTKTIVDKIDEVKAERRRLKREAKEREQREQAEKLKRNLKRAIDRQNVKAFLLNLWDEIGGIIDDEYKTLYNVMERETKDYILDNIDDPWSIINDDWLTDEIWKIITQ